ncbi:MAG TPA: SxtJ family membrane protein [Alphaproteobacteria bacterium]|nr:SxtJ family membrane protein [Alphaproteobacteria bacterium]
MHEEFDREEEIAGSSDRTFGLVMAAGFALVGAAPLLHRGLDAVRWWSIALALAFLLAALVRPSLLAPLNRLWLRFGLLLARIVSPIGLALLYFTTLVPVGLLVRATGGDPLRLRRDPAATSYWIRRTPPGPAPESMKNQF